MDDLTRTIWLAILLGLILLPLILCLYKDNTDVEANPYFLKKRIKRAGFFRKMLKKDLSIEQIKAEIENKKYNYRSVIILDKDMELDNLRGYIYPHTVIFSHRSDGDYCMNLYNVKGEKWLVLHMNNEQEAYNSLIMCLRYIDRESKRKMKKILRAVRLENNRFYVHKVVTCTDKLYGENELTEDDIAPLFIMKRALCWYTEEVWVSTLHGGGHYENREDYTVYDSTRVYEFLNSVWKKKYGQYKIRELTQEEIKEARHMYNIIVKRLHPDANERTSEHELELFSKAVEAYKTNDTDALRSILYEIESDVNPN